MGLFDSDCSKEKSRVVENDLVRAFEENLAAHDVVHSYGHFQIECFDFRWPNSTEISCELIS